MPDTIDRLADLERRVAALEAALQQRAAAADGERRVSEMIGRAMVTLDGCTDVLSRLEATLDALADGPPAPARRATARVRQ